MGRAIHVVRQEKVSVQTNVVFRVLLRETLSVKGNKNGEVFPDELRTQREMRRGRRKRRGEEMTGGRRKRHQVDEKHNTTARNALIRLLCCWTVIGSTGQSTWVVGGDAVTFTPQVNYKSFN